MPLAGEPVPKVAYVEVTAVLADGSRTIVRYEPNSRERLEVAFEWKHEDYELDPAPVGLMRFAERTDGHAMTVKNAGVVSVQHLVPVRPGQ